MTSAAATNSDANVTMTPELIGEATSLKQFQALLKTVDPSGVAHTTKKQALTALIHHAIKQAKSAESTAARQPTIPTVQLLPRHAQSLSLHTKHNASHRSHLPQIKTNGQSMITN